MLPMRVKRAGPHLRGGAVLAAFAVAALISAMPGSAQQTGESSVSLKDSFPIGTNGLCEAQIQPARPDAGLFDREYDILCRDAAAPVGTMWAVRSGSVQSPAARFAGPESDCEAAGTVQLPGVRRDATRLSCSRTGSAIGTQVLTVEADNRIFAASGLSAYATALELGLSTLVQDRLVDGEVDIPLTETTDALAFARQQARAIDANRALVEAYNRANSGEFAEAAEFFAASADESGGKNEWEARLNEGLLQSNLGNSAEAQRLFEQASPRTASDPVLARLQRNYETLEALNRGRADQALSIVNTPLPRDFGDIDASRELQIGPALAGRLSVENETRIGADPSSNLTPLERAQLLDGQAQYLRATALRLSGEGPQAERELARADATLSAVRDGRVTSIAWLRAQVSGELAELAEAAGRPGRAEALHRNAIAMLEYAHPASPALYSAQAQLAGLFSRTGRRDEAIGLYREIVAQAEGRPTPTLKAYMSDYFGLLLADGESRDAASEVFAASQLLLRPGLAQTQAVLARELSGGSDEASRLFRRSVNIGRSIEQLMRETVQLEARAQEDDAAAQLLPQQQAQLAQLQERQAELLQNLSEYPRFRAVSGGAVELSAMQSILGGDEAYVKMVSLEDEVFVVYVAAGDALTYRVQSTPDELEDIVSQIRDSIALAEAGQIYTFPFDLKSSRELYTRLFDPIADRLPGHRHIVFEPDGAMLQLPINLLVVDDESLVRYDQRLEQPGGDEFDFRGVAWLGRNSQISTSVAPSAFRDVRAAPSSSASNAYLGLGENTPIGDGPAGRSATRSALAGGEDCRWSNDIWASPIRADELYDAARRFGGADAARTSVVTRDQFTDTAIRTRNDLNDYRILHFATHGLVTAPEPQCPPRPALLTSFGEGDSDGLLSFAEIFGLRLDADLVILSACDTAGSATVGATIEAGITSGGGYALDGLVRAFVGAGGRTVLASHWPVPDVFDATTRLISGIFEAQDNETAEALRLSQIELMDDARTSHPFYWSAFAIVGDGNMKLTR